MSTIPSRRRASIVALGTSAVLGLGLTAVQAPQATACARRERAHTGRRPAALPGPLAAGRPAGRRPARPDDARGEDRPDDPGRARRRRRRHHPRSPPTTSAACCPAAARCRRRTRPTAWADMVDRYQAAALTTRLAHPADLRRRHRARRRQHARRHGLPAQHRPRRHPRPGAGAQRRAHRRRRRPGRAGRSGPSRPASAWPATTAGAAPTSRSARRPALVESMETAIDGLQGTPGHLADNDRVLATAKHFAGDGLTTYGTGSNSQDDRRLPDRPGRRPGRPRDVPTGSRSRRTSPAVQAAPRRLGDAVVLRRRLDRGRPRQPDQHARQPAT